MHVPAVRLQLTSADPALVALIVPVAPASSAVTSTVNVGVVSLVLSSVFDTPESLAASRFGKPIDAGVEASITIAQVSAMFAPVGNDVEVMALPAVSATVPITKLFTVRSLDASPACTM